MVVVNFSTVVPLASCPKIAPATANFHRNCANSMEWHFIANGKPLSLNQKAVFPLINQAKNDYSLSSVQAI